jgi:hypothetical protein
MSIRSNSLPTRGDLSSELQDILRRNGMQAHIIRHGDGFQLAVQGHDSPLLTYPINDQQLKAMTDWGTNYANKNAYNTFAALVGNDFYLPRNFVHARNANGRVAMGLHGYRIGVGEYGRMPLDRRGLQPMLGMHDDRFLGWTPRQQEGFHMRRVGGRMFMQGAPMVPERPDGRVKPGELLNGGYGFYYKGQQPVTQQPQQDVLADLQTVIIPVEAVPRRAEPAKPYKDLITSKVYFTDEKFRECLDSHGIVIDPEKKTLTIQSSATKQDFVYDLTEEEVKKLTSNSIKEVPLQQRLDLLNEVVKGDFSEKITLDMLNSKEQVNIKLLPEVETQLNARETELQQQVINTQPLDAMQVQPEQEDRTVGHVDGTALYEMNEDKAWFREGRHGREVMVDDIKVEPVKNEQGEVEKNDKGEAKYRMTAVINGESISHEITQKQYDKFMAIDDYHRMKLFSHIFNEVDMKNIPGQHSNIGAKIGGALLAGLTVTSELSRGFHDHSGPAVFMEQHGPDRPHVYFKPGVDSPQELASRAFDAGLNAGEHGVGMGHGR